MSAENTTRPSSQGILAKLKQLAVGKKQVPTNTLTSESFGAEISPINGRRRWQLSGTALKDWEELEPRIRDILNNKTGLIYKGHCEHQNIGVHCWIVGYNEAQAYPIIFISSAKEHHQIAKNCIKVLEELGIFTKGFKGKTMAGSIRLIASSGVASQSAIITPPPIVDAQHPPLSGADILVPVNHGLDRSAGERRATGTMVLDIDGRLAMLGPAHAFTASNAAYSAFESERSCDAEFYDSEWEEEEDAVVGKISMSEKLPFCQSPFIKLKSRSHPNIDNKQRPPETAQTFPDLSHRKIPNMITPLAMK
jgi:hypothetical protein